MKIEKLINQHPSFFDDLRIASGLLESRRPIIAAALAEYAEALAEYDDDNPSLVVKTANECMEEASKLPEPWEDEWKITPEGDLEHAKFDPLKTPFDVTDSDGDNHTVIILKKA